MSAVNVQLLGAIILLINLKSVYSECPQRTFNFVKGHVCDSKRICSSVVRTVDECVGPETVLEDTIFVNLLSETSYWRRGAFHDLPELFHVAAIATGLNRLNPGVFLNLPNFNTVELSSNKIEEILWGVFSDTSISELDLSWNSISYIENRAFSYMPNLWKIQLQRNKLREFRQSWFENSTNLIMLTLAYNQLTEIVPRAFNLFPNLSYLDLSFNKISLINFHAFENVKHLETLDLTSNELSYVKPDVFLTKIRMDVLKLSLNRLSFLSTEFLKVGDVRSLVLHPNPWQCPCLNSLLEWMYQNNVTLISPSEDDRIKYDITWPECSINPRSREKCVVGYDDAFLLAQAAFFRAVNYSASVWNPSNIAMLNFNYSPLQK